VKRKNWSYRENPQPRDCLNCFQMAQKVALKFKTISIPLDILVKNIQTGDRRGGYTHFSDIFSSL
jgi:hypothetical protein